MKRIPILLAVLALSFSAPAAIPLQINHQGVASVVATLSSTAAVENSLMAVGISLAAAGKSLVPPEKSLVTGGMSLAAGGKSLPTGGKSLAVPEKPHFTAKNNKISNPTAETGASHNCHQVW